MTNRWQDHWSDFPEYSGIVLSWKKQQDTANKYIFHTKVNSQLWQIRLNNFPDEPLYTLIVGGCEIIHFNDWPSEWEKDKSHGK